MASKTLAPHLQPIEDEISRWTGSQELGEFADHLEKKTAFSNNAADEQDHKSFFETMIISCFWLDVKADQWSFASPAGYSGWQGGEAKWPTPGCGPRSLPCWHGRASRSDQLGLVVSRPCQSWRTESKRMSNTWELSFQNVLTSTLKIVSHLTPI